MEITIINCEIDLDLKREPDAYENITLETVDGPKQVEARMYGPFALHPRVATINDPFWDSSIPSVTLTHTRSGEPVVSLQMNDPIRLIEVMESLVANLEAAKLNWEVDTIKDMPKIDIDVMQAVMKGYLKAFTESTKQTCDCPACTTRRIFGLG